ncbi:MAG TPA: hypothetical protein VFT20_16075 [Candidatus Limnocylindrales bacterium]|nr:hypothetical protein [Candidatus Limnocylindrales bacterium]
MSAIPHPHSELQIMRTSSSVAALIFVGTILVALGVLGGAVPVIGIGSVLLLAAGLFQTLDNRRGPAVG